MTQQFCVKQVSCTAQKNYVSQNPKKDINLLNLSLEKAIKENYDWPLHCR